MPLNSLPYLLCLIVAITIFWLLPSTGRRLFVLAASLTFYASWGMVFLWLPVFVAIVVYVCGIQIQHSGKGARRWMWSGVSIALLPLIALKYRGFLLGSLDVLARWHGAQSVSPIIAIALPFGISF